MCTDNTEISLHACLLVVYQNSGKGIKMQITFTGGMKQLEKEPAGDIVCGLFIRAASKP